MRTQAGKLGRNENCPCGSSKKYKKCCLSKERPSVIVSSEAVGAVKMSEVLLEYAEELLELASTPAEGEKAIMVAVMAWNLSFQEDTEHKKQIEEFFQIMKINIKNRATITKMIKELIYKRRQIYGSINRLIVNYKIIKKRKDFNLNVISTLADTDNNSN